MPLPIEIHRIKEILKKNNNSFIETGFHVGDGVSRALELGYQRIYSIEIDKEACRLGRAKFKNEIQSGTIKLIEGSSENVLPALLKKLSGEERITFWLDAHERRVQDFEKKCPLYDELTAIKNHHIKNHIIIIDDFRQISENINAWTKEVETEAIVDRIKEINSNYIVEEIEYVRNKKANSVLVAFV